MTKRKNNAQEPAADIEEAVGQDQSPAGVEQEAAALVEGDGAQAPDGAEHEGEPAGTDAGASRSGLVDADVPFGDAQADTLEAARPDDLGDGSGLGAGAAPGDADAGGGAVEGSDGAHAGGDRRDVGVGDDGDTGGNGSSELSGGPAPQPEEGAEGAGSAGENIGERGVVTDDPPAPYFRAADHHAENEAVARGVASMVFDQVLRIMGNDDHAAWQVAEAYGELVALTEAQASVAASLLREIGIGRATVAVVETQLQIKGTIGRPLLMPEQIALDAFLFAVASLDGAAAGLEAQIAAAVAEANARPAPPVPIDETTLEPVDDVNATWG